MLSLTLTHRNRNFLFFNFFFNFDFQKYPALTLEVAGDLRRAPVTFENTVTAYKKWSSDMLSSVMQLSSKSVSLQVFCSCIIVTTVRG